MDFLTIAGVIGAIAAILGGQALEGGHVGSLIQGPAFVIVFGGTLGATLVAYPLNEFRTGLVLIKAAFQQKVNDSEAIVQQVLELAGVARRDGVLALESRLGSIDDPFLKRAVGYIVDGIDAAIVRESLETEIHHEYEAGNTGAKVFESAGGFAPTIGILGAVLGLIHVMDNLTDPSKLGPGIATAFVATVYGVGSANLILLPMGTKIRRKLLVEKQRKTLMTEGVLSIQEGLNPRVLEEKLRAYAGRHDDAAE